MDPNESEVTKLANLIRDLMLSDSSIVLDEHDYEELAQTVAEEDQRPTCDECEELVMGDVEEISLRFPKIASFIDSFF